MTIWARLRARFRPAEPPPLPEPVMHLLGPGFRPACGTAYGPAHPITVERSRVTCPRCRELGDRRALVRLLRHR
jgi:hypothetical protein